MNKINELKYIQQLPLKNLKKVPSGYICSCPICHEGKSPWRTRLYILTQKKSFITVFCHNCGYDTNLKTFIREISPHLYEDYKVEERNELLSDLKNGTLNRKDVEIKSNINSELALKFIFTLGKNFIPAKQNTLAIDFCKRRKIVEFIDQLYYNIHPNHTLSGMIIFPFYLEDRQNLYGFQGRHTQEKRFHTHSKNEAMKIYNFFNVNFEEPIYIFESIIDSMMMPNSLAMMGVSLSEATEKKMRNPIYVMDNDKRGIQTAVKYAAENKKIFIYPKSFKYKDFNEAVCKGVKKSELKQMVMENTYQGFSATVRLNLAIRSGKSN